MKLTCGLTLTLPLLLVLLLAVATKGHTVLQCYVCDDCEKVDKSTPMEQCGGEHFSTTMKTSPSMSPSESTTMPSTTPSTTTTTTTRQSSPIPQSDSTANPSSTEDPIQFDTTRIELSTPSTNSSVSATTDSSTSFTTTTTTPDNNNNTTRIPINPRVSLPISDEVSPTLPVFDLENVNLTIPSVNFTETVPSVWEHNRQRRHTEFNGITYYCYKIQKKYENVFGTKRGCIGVKTEKSVCDELNAKNNNRTKKCTTCQTTMCNGSSALGVSIATLLVALLAVIYKV